MITHLVAVLMLLLSACSWAQEPSQADPGFLQARDGKLFRGGREYRAVGVSMPYALSIFAGNMNREIERASFATSREQFAQRIAAAAAGGLAFIQFAIRPPMDEHIDVKDYWIAMDDLMATCRNHGIKVMPALCASPYPFQGSTDERLAAVLDEHSKTHAWVYRFASAVVKRYKDDPNIIAWNLPPYTSFASSRHGIMGPDDRLSLPETVRFYAQLASFIKMTDPHHAIFVNEKDCVRAMECRLWGIDMIDGAAAKADIDALGRQGLLDGLTIWDCGPDIRPVAGQLRGGEYTIQVVQRDRQAGMPILVSGVSFGPAYYGQDVVDDWTIRRIDNLESAGANLIEVCDWDLQGPSKLMGRVVDFNRAYGSLPSSFKETPSNF